MGGICCDEIFVLCMDEHYRSKNQAKPMFETYLQAPPDWLLDPISGIMNTSPGPACFPLKQFMNEMLVNIFFHIKIKLRGIVYQNFL